jgi:CheY-like chemotaxis protein
MEGDIWVESELGIGSTFIFYVKVEEGKASKEVLLPGDVNWDNLRILAVDDAPEILELFRNLLLSYGASCETALSGAEAIGKLEECGENPMDIIFLDLRMPGMNGMELTREIKRRERGSKKPKIIMLSGIDLTDIEKEAREAGEERFMQKPLLPSMLVNCINECLDKSVLTGRDEPEEATLDQGVLAGKKVLLAEDVEINREIVQTLLEYTGLQIDFAFDGQEALDKFIKSPGAYDLILMDIHMPNLSGYEATELIRSSGFPESTLIPIIAMTANVFREDIERCLNSGMNDHLGKPIDANELVEKLKKYLL